MSIIAAFAVAHPPLAIPEVGRGQEHVIGATIEGYRQMAQRIAQLAPDTIVVVSPHAIMYSDYLHISPGTSAWGDMSRFGAPQVRIEKHYDHELASLVAKLAQAQGLAAGTKGQRDKHLDHGVLVPLYFVEQCYRDYRLVRVSIAGLPFIDHYRLGQCIASASQQLGRRTVVVASGDLSHKLKEDGPYGFDAAGPVYDQRVTAALGTGDFGDLLLFDEDFCEQAAECGHRSFIEMAGALDGRAVEACLMSHEGPFGVGYATAWFVPGKADDTRRFGDAFEARAQARLQRVRAGEDAFVRLARLQVESIVGAGARLDAHSPQVEALLASEPAAALQLRGTRAGAFVSIHEHGRLRGCIGTIAATCPSLADEILQNAVSAATRDPRFDAIAPEELPFLEISVDVLGEAEPIGSLDQLDVKRYGVIVSCGMRRGLLLPDLEGVDTPRQQVDIALQKGGIDPSEPYALQRFEVIRHT